MEHRGKFGCSMLNSSFYLLDVCPSFLIWDWIQRQWISKMVLKNLSTIVNHQLLINLHHVFTQEVPTFFVESLQGTGSLLQLSAAPAQENQHLKRYTSSLQPLNVTTAGCSRHTFCSPSAPLLREWVLAVPSLSGQDGNLNKSHKKSWKSEGYTDMKWRI